MATFTLSDLKKEVDKKYAPTVIENGDDVYTLPNLLQMGVKQRTEVMALIKQIENHREEDEEDTIIVDRHIELIKAVVSDGKGEELLELLGDSPAMVLELIISWMDGIQLGEA